MVSLHAENLLRELAHRHLSRACASHLCRALAHHNLCRALAQAEQLAQNTWAAHWHRATLAHSLQHRRRQNLRAAVGECVLGELEGCLQTRGLAAVLQHSDPRRVIHVLGGHVHEAPPDWKAYFGKHHVSHFSISLEDVRSAPARDHADFEPRAIALFETCVAACSRLRKLRQELAQAGEPCNVLMHCVGGINRSSAMLCTWLIVAHDMAAEAAVAQLFKQDLPCGRGEAATTPCGH